ncbi:Hexulose 6 phosphate synthase (HUMPS) [Spiroplasma clarkii]|uniref:3-dehydro-L-gulonate-6-phosphate decarboxylase n=1 Tax=Spiroplasma clarkii TaxID=2139 RepID=A0A1Y0L2E9_9MOLU|nr:3-keto-L-gulonate-6-phosphate decarboxylase UlaD [Spiroplasma clarkii]ARU91895.1 Hexulose 6 phosphate synthase (HUMPS) [Spiroplasma clarkii]ATX71242.1 3-dehydro-L-gulonate-6-phosphate decarboxylase [Spiroplasma clarkii]
MKKPLLQVALDNLSLPDALKTLASVGEKVDIIEIGTILLLAEGKIAVKIIKDKYPNKIILADAKIADAGQIVSKMFFEVGAHLTTVICCADLPTVTGALEVAKTYQGDVQIELTGTWDFQQAAAWKAAGIEQVVYHRSRDAQAAGVGWGAADITKITKLCDMGFKVTITGGITEADLDLFKHLPIYIIIAGRSIRDAADPQQAAESFQKQLARKWENA